MGTTYDEQLKFLALCTFACLAHYGLTGRSGIMLVPVIIYVLFALADRTND